MRFWWQVLLACGLMMAPARCVRAGANPTASGSTIELAGPSFGTTYSVIVVAPSVDSVELRGRIQALLDQIDAEMSLWREDSELSRFNASSETDWFDVSPATAHVVSVALQVSRITGGAFDPTVSPLVELWSFGPQSLPVRIPDPDEIAAARAHVGISFVDVRLDPPALRKLDPEVQLDLNAIAKGNAVDRVAGLLDAYSPQGYMVEIGGEVRTSGTKADGSLWNIGLEQPAIEQRVVQSVLQLGDASLATSGDYRNFVEINGKRYSHTIDPRTGYPIDHHLAAVSVLAEDCTKADAWATALMVVGPEAGPELATEAAIEALFITRNDGQFQTTATAGFPPRRPFSEVESASLPTGTFSTFLIAALVFAIAIAGMSAGVILSNRRLRGSCGGLSGLKDDKGNPLCDACTQPARECDEFRRQMGHQAAATPGTAADGRESL